jgi:hypothetical protein
LVNTLTITIPLQQLTEDFAIELTDLVMKNKGNVNLYVQVIDELSPNKVMLFARQYRFQMNKSVYHTLKRAKAEGIIDFHAH